ncbi:C-5 cytosine-specific DNA methylase [Vibrio sp. B1FLJ16]|nr:C-5 cytosine-specific DNA methylase [Vibrio sp. B1FLJ16]CAE6945370.1 C-5 cytosine-specific DNA methylase [Vibrio sp. B1FLJ16]
MYHYALKHQTKGNGFGFGLINPKNPDSVTHTLSARYYKDGSEIHINQDGLSAEYLERNKEHGIRKNQEREKEAIAYADKFREEYPECSDKQYKEMIKEREKIRRCERPLCP